MALLAGAYSADLRERVLAAVEAGEAMSAVARRFAVGRSTVQDWARALRRDGRRVAGKMGGHRKPVIAGKAEAALRRVLESANHLTLVRSRRRTARARRRTLISLPSGTRTSPSRSRWPRSARAARSCAPGSRRPSAALRGRRCRRHAAGRSPRRCASPASASRPGSRFRSMRPRPRSAAPPRGALARALSRMPRTFRRAGSRKP